MFSTSDALLLPVIARGAPVQAEIEDSIGKDLDVVLALAAFTRPINYLGLPAIAVPIHAGTNPMPFGFQLVGRPRSEALLMRIAYAFERAVPPRFPD